MYRSSNNWQSDLRRRFVMAGIPATLTIMGATIFVWFALAFTRSPSLYRLLGFHSMTWPLPFPWTVATWPILEGGFPIWVIFALAWAYTVCGSMERSWGTRVFLNFFLATNALTALTFYLGGALLHTPVGLSGLWTGIASTTIAWCLTHRREKVCLWGLLSIPTLWLAWLEVVIVWFESGGAILGLFALSGCAAAYAYVTQVRHGGFSFPNGDFRPRPSNPPTGRESDKPSGFSLSRYLRDRRERRRLEDLFRRSGYDDRDQR